MCSRKGARRALIVLVGAVCGPGMLPGPPAGVATAASFRCRSVSLKKHFPAYGWQLFRARFCFDRTTRRVVYGGVNVTRVVRNAGGDALDFKISGERKDQANLGPRILLISNLSTVEACLVHCFHSETNFKVRAYWDGGYQWRINNTTGQIAGPP